MGGFLGVRGRNGRLLGEEGLTSETRRGGACCSARLGAARLCTRELGRKRTAACAACARGQGPRAWPDWPWLPCGRKHGKRKVCFLYLFKFLFLPIYIYIYIYVNMDIYILY